MNNIKVWPHVTLIALACAVLGGIAAALWVRQEPTTQAAALPYAARVERVDGDVGLTRSLDNTNFDDRWIEVTPNTPISVGDRIYAREGSQAAIAFTGRNFARLEPDSALDVLDLSDGRTQLALRDGSAIFNVGELDSDDLFEVATPHGAFDLQQPGLYEVGLNDDGSAWVSVLSGLAQVVGLAGSGEIGKGEMLTLLGQTAADVVLSRISPDYAGGLVDDYYGYQYPDTYDGRYRDYDAYLNDPYYYDPYNRYASYRHVNDAVPGVWELDRYGDWQDVSGYGYAWRPRVEEGWAPYQQGYWMMDDPHGLTWVSNEPWGYAPYHYGRWVNNGGQWYWVPEGVNTQPVYSPALVAFVPSTQQNVIGWVPLAPGDPYAPAYYDANWQPHYTNGAPVVEQFVNLDVPGAVTVIPVEYFDRVIDRDMLARSRPQRFDQARPVLDPLSVALLRQAALQTTNTHRRVDMPPGLAKRLDTTQVYTSARPFAPPFRDDPSKALRVEAVPDKQKKQRLQFRDERQQAAQDAPARTNAPGSEERRGRQAATLEADAARGDREARRAAQELRREERNQQRDERRQAAAPRRDDGAARAANERAVRASEQRAQAERVANNERAQRDAARRQQQDGRRRSSSSNAPPCGSSTNRVVTPSGRPHSSVRINSSRCNSAPCGSSRRSRSASRACRRGKRASNKLPRSRESSAGKSSRRPPSLNGRRNNAAAAAAMAAAVAAARAGGKESLNPSPVALRPSPGKQRLKQEREGPRRTIVAAPRALSLRRGR